MSDNNNININNNRRRLGGLGAVYAGLIFLFCVFVIIAITGFSTIVNSYDDLSAQIEELSKYENADNGSSRVISKSYIGMLEAVTVQADNDKVDYYIVVGGCYVSVSEQEYLKAKDNIGKSVTVETESTETKSASGHYTSTYSVEVTYEEE